MIQYIDIYQVTGTNEADDFPCEFSQDIPLVIGTRTHSHPRFICIYII